MRRTEAALAILVAVVWAVAYSVGLSRTTFLLVALIVLVVTVAHLVVDSARWQLAVTYLTGLSIVATAALTVFYSDNTLPGIEERWFGLGPGSAIWPVHIGFVLIGLAMALGVLLAIGLPVARTRPLGGIHAVGTQTVLINSTIETNSSPSIQNRAGQNRSSRNRSSEGTTSQARPLMMQVWYPAKDSSGPVAPYLPNLKVGGQALAKTFRVPSFVLGHLDLIKPNARFEPPVAASTDRFPVLLFSHGRTGTRVQNTHQVEELVSHGYLVAAVDHLPGSGYSVFPNGEVVSYDPSIFGDDSPAQSAPVVSQWATDMTYMLDELEALDNNSASRLCNRLDLGRVGAFGHSTGGGAALELCHRDQRCGPVAVYDPWLNPVSDEAVQGGLDEPVMVLKQNSPLSVISESRLHDLLRNTTDLAVPIGGSPSSANQYLFEVAGAKHMDFNDYKQLMPILNWFGITGSIRKSRIEQILNEATRAFFDVHLLGQGSDLDLDKIQTEFPEVSSSML